MTAKAARPQGIVLAVRGAVVDVGFAAGELPPINEALVIEWDHPAPPVVEVQAHLDEATVRGVALQATAGLQQGVPVRATGNPITVPVGDAVLGRLLDITANVRDHGPPLPDGMQRSPINRRAPALADRSPATAIFETGIKVIDLLAPLAREARRRCSAARGSARRSW